MLHLADEKGGFGAFCEEQDPGVDADGRPSASYCRDINAGSLHIGITNLLGIQRRSVIEDQVYDALVVERLTALHTEALPAVASMGDGISRMSPYAHRLVEVLAKVQAGETKMFTGVMCGSYHDVWMELHEDLILTQGIDRAAEGSF